MRWLVPPLAFAEWSCRSTARVPDPSFWNELEHMQALTAASMEVPGGPVLFGVVVWPEMRWSVCSHFDVL